jgi:hypothetical protein
VFFLLVEGLSSRQIVEVVGTQQILVINWVFVVVASLNKNVLVYTNRIIGKKKSLPIRSNKLE